MASTNKTTHYELSQYVGSDKPTYLGDYNGDMLKIDTAINTAKTTADSASTAATNASTAAETAQTTANTAVTNAATAQTTANTANTNIGTLANLTTTEKTSLVGAINEVNAKNDVVDSMSGTQTNKAPSVNSIKTYLDGEVLYNNVTGTNGNVTLSSNISNYKFIEIYGDKSGCFGYIKVTATAGLQFDLAIHNVYDTNSIQQIFANYHFNNEGTQIVKEREIYMNNNGAPDTSNDIYITKVVGLKY